MVRVTCYIHSEEVKKMNELLPFISDVGFPIVVTMYVLLRLEQKLDAVRQSIEQLPAHLKEATSSSVH